MKNGKVIIATFFALLYIFATDICALASQNGLDTENLDLDDEETFLSSVKISMFRDETEKNSIQCFDVSDDGLIAIGTEKSRKKYVSVYDSKGSFSYGYEFECYGTYGIEWSGDDIIIYFIRDNIALQIDAMGNIVNIVKVLDTMDNSLYMRQNVFSDEKYYNGNKYLLKNDLGILNFFASSYSQITIIDDDGNETTVYDVSNLQMYKYIIISSLIIVFLAMFAVILISKIRKR